MLRSADTKGVMSVKWEWEIGVTRGKKVLTLSIIDTFILQLSRDQPRKSEYPAKVTA